MHATATLILPMRRATATIAAVLLLLIAADERPAAVLREGSIVSAAVATLHRADPGSALQVQVARSDGSGSDDFILLPCRRMEELEAAAPEHDGTFLVGGEVFVFGGVQFLLPLEVAILQEPTRRSHPTEVPAAPGADDGSSQDHEDSISDIVADLQRATGSLAQSIRIASQYPIDPEYAIAEGTRIASRRARLVRNSAGAWVAVFTADATGLSDPPATILPGRQLALLAKWARAGGFEAPVLLTGEFVSYHGHAFLVLRSWRSVHRTDHLDGSQRRRGDQQSGRGLD